MADVVIQVRANGPFRVRGPFQLIDAEGNPFTLPEGEFVSLCRCGQSGKRPFCDGAHRACGFTAPDAAPSP